MIQIQVVDQFVPQKKAMVTFIAAKDLRLRRITGAIQWPTSIDPGFSIIVGEDYLKDEHLRMHHLRILAESEHAGIDDLLQWCEMQEHHLPPELYWSWQADTDKRHCMEFVWQIRKRNAERKGDFDSLPLSPAPYIGSQELIPFISKILRRYLSTDPVSLHFLDDSSLRNKVFSVQSEDAMPNAVLALGYAVTALVTGPQVGEFQQ
jgi:hypothetical protein